MKTPIDLLDDLVGFAGKFFPDKDKAAEFALKAEELKQQIALKLLSTTTTPRADAFVKIVYALGDVSKGLARPLGSAIAFLFGMTHPEMVQAAAQALPADAQWLVPAATFGAFPGWMTSRHFNKKGEKEET
jgi:hypothetical protein